MSETVTNKSMSDTIQRASVSKDIMQEDFYVLQDEDEEFIEQKTSTKIQIMEPEKYTKNEQTADADPDVFDLTEDIPTEEQEEDVEFVKKPKESADDLGEDFFEQGEDEDAEKKKIVEEIAGMSETTETVEGLVDDKTDETTTSEIKSEKPVSIQFSEQGSTDDASDMSIELEKFPGKKSIEIRSSIPIVRRTLPDGSKKSLLTLSGEGSATRRRRTSSVVIADSRFSFIKKDGADLSIPDYFGKPIQKMYDANLRGTFYAEFGPRYRQLDDDEWDFDIGGDGAPIFFEVIAEEEEETIIQEEEAPIKLERQPFYSRHDKAVNEIIVRKIKNFILHKKLSMYFKRKKMDYVTKEVDWSFDTQTKYNKKLESYGDLLDFMVFEKHRVTLELDETKKLRVDKYKKLTTMFKKMQDREGEVGYGLISSKTGNVLPDKFVERLIRRQNTQLTQVSSMRLTYIRLKGMVQEKLDSISNLNEIAPGFLLVDYEQLKSDNRAYADKIEEKDEELTRLRIKCGSTIQVLAHLREKTSALDNDLEDLIHGRGRLEEDYFEVRSRLNEQKQARDNVRHALNKLRDESGLLTQPTLLKDMEQGLKDVKHLTNQLKQIMKEHKKKSNQITTIRKKIEQTVDLRRGFSRKDLSVLEQSTTRNLKKEKSTKVYKGRPSLMMPVIEDSAFTMLKAIAPKLTNDRCHRNRIHIKQSKRAGG